MDTQSYLIRYGVMSHVGRFATLPVHQSSLERGQIVVLQTDRGVELGEVLAAVEGKSGPGAGVPENLEIPSQDDDPFLAVSAEGPRILRLAGPDDLSRSRHAAESRLSHFSLCERILGDGNWPWEVVDVEPLLDGRSTVIHYLGPHHLDVASLRARFRVECDLDVVLEPVGEDPESAFADEQEHPEENSGEGCGSCGGSDGGCCGTAPVSRHTSDDHHHQTAEATGGGCAVKAHSGCSSCGISRLLADKNRART